MKEVIIKRVFDAPQQKVFNAWSNPEILKEWWAPEDFETGHMEIDFQEGGRIFYSFVSKDGFTIWGRGVYKTIDEPNHILYEDCFTDENGNDVAPSHYGMNGDEPYVSMVDVQFEEADGKTTMTVTMDAADPNTEELEAGWNTMFDKLAKELA